MSAAAAARVEVLAQRGRRRDEVLTGEALAFVAGLHARFEPARRELLERRREAQRARDAGGAASPTGTHRTAGFAIDGGPAEARAPGWRVAPAPADLDDRRVEITGPVDAKMMINALGSGAKVFMADLEDACSPTWDNVVDGQVHLADAVRRRLAFTSPEGKEYRLPDRPATLVVRPRGWHLVERHVTVGGEPVSASLFDFGLYFFHNARELIERGSGPYFYLPKLEGHLEAKLWNDVFVHAQEELGIPRGTVRATVLVETLPAAFEMEAILWQLREHSAGLNAGRWDYIFSVIKTHRERDAVLPDRAQVTMTVPFMRAYTERLVAACHRRGAHAIGGMAAFIPNRRDVEVTERALAAVRADKEREADDGFDGTWVAHPDLVPVAAEVLDRTLGDRPHQKERLREDGAIPAEALLDLRVPGGTVTASGVAANVRVALAYLDAWLQGRGAVAIDDLMEDTATAEIARVQLWQWRRHEVRLDDGHVFDNGRYRAVRDAELARLGGRDQGRLGDAVRLLDRLVLAESCPDFLTLEAYPLLE